MHDEEIITRRDGTKWRVTGGHRHFRVPDELVLERVEDESSLAVKLCRRYHEYDAVKGRAGPAWDRVADYVEENFVSRDGLMPAVDFVVSGKDGVWIEAISEKAKQEYVGGEYWGILDCDGRRKIIARLYGEPYRILLDKEKEKGV